MPDYRVYLPPRINSRSSPSDTPRLPKGAILLIDAINRIGKHKYPDEWTGLEVFARQLSPLAERVRVLNRRLEAPTVEGSGSSFAVRNYRLTPTPIVATPDDTAMHEAETNARKRFEGAREELIAWLGEAELTATCRDQLGKPHDIESGFWLTPGVAKAFDLSDDPNKWRTAHAGEYPCGGREPIQAWTTYVEANALQTILENQPQGAGSVSDKSGIRGKSKRRTCRNVTAKDSQKLVEFAEGWKANTGTPPTDPEVWENFSYPKNLNRPGHQELMAELHQKRDDLCYKRGMKKSDRKKASISG